MFLLYHVLNESDLSLDMTCFSQFIWVYYVLGRAGESMPVLAQHIPHACWACWGHAGGKGMG